MEADVVATDVTLEDLEEYFRVGPQALTDTVATDLQFAMAAGLQSHLRPSTLAQYKSKRSTFKLMLDVLQQVPELMGPGIMQGRNLDDLWARWEQLDPTAAKEFEFFARHMWICLAKGQEKLNDQASHGVRDAEPDAVLKVAGRSQDLSWPMKLVGDLCSVLCLSPCTCLPYAFS